MDLECEFWPFDLLAGRRAGKDPLRSVPEANMIVIAVGSDEELPQYVKDWLEDSLAAKWPMPAALVALLAGEEQPRKKPSRIHDYLSEIADRRNINFFCSLTPGGSCHDMKTAQAARN